MKAPSPIKAMTPSDAPIPMPAFAPVESPLFRVAAAVLDAGGAGAVVEDALDEAKEDAKEAEEAEDGVEEEKMDEDDEAVGMGSPNRAAIMYRAIPLPLAQQLVVTPQHHVVDSETFSSQGVTLTSVPLCDCALLVFIQLSASVLHQNLLHLSIALDTPRHPSYFLYMILDKLVG
jgi:hypothetical protein